MFETIGKGYREGLLGGIRVRKDGRIFNLAVKILPMPILGLTSGYCRVFVDVEDYNLANANGVLTSAYKSRFSYNPSGMSHKLYGEGHSL